MCLFSSLDQEDREMTKTTVLAGANDEQQEAIKHQEGACMIIAGPGSGKTKTVVSRTQYMILNGIDPSQRIWS